MSKATLPKAESPSNDLIPVSYEEYLSSLPDPQRTTLLHGWCETLRVKGFNDLFDGSASREALHQFFLAKIRNFNFLENILSSLKPAEYEFLRDFARQGAVLLIDGNPALRGNTSQALEQKGLLLRFPRADKTYLVLPLEIAFMISSHMVESRQSFPPYLFFLIYSSYSANFLRYLALHAGISIQQNHKLPIAVCVYQSITKKTAKNCPDLSSLEKEILELVFSWGEEMQDHEFNERVGGASSRDGYYPYTNPLSEFFSQPTEQLRKRLTDQERALINLIAQGLIGIKKGQYYQSHCFVIPQETRRCVSDLLEGDLREKRRRLDSSLFVPEPKAIVSFSSGIIDNLQKIQLAVCCGMLEVTKQNVFKKKSLKDISELLRIPEFFLSYQVTPFSYGIDPATGRCFLPKIEFDGYKIIRDFLARQKIYIPVLKVLCGLNGWVDRERLCEYLLSCAETRSFRKYITKEFILNTVAWFVSLGLLDAAQDQSCLRASKTALEVMEGKKISAIPMISSQSKPLIVQPNLDLLLPYNCELKLISRIAMFCEITAIDKMLHFKLTTSSLLRAIDLNWKIRQIKELLEEHANGVPPAVIHFLDGVGEKEGEAVVFPCQAVIQCKGLGLKEKIFAIKQLNPTLLEGHNDLVMVRGEEFEQVIALLKKKGVLAVSSLENPNASLTDKLKLYSMKKIPVSCRIKNYSGKIEKFDGVWIRRIFNDWVDFEYFARDKISGRAARDSFSAEINNIVSIEESVGYEL